MIRPSFSDRLQAFWYGQRDPLLAVLTRPLSWLFGLLASLRRALFRLGILSCARLPVPVVVVGNIHVGGAGKTMACVASIMESKRMGFTSKPMVVVPNHLLYQWRDEFYRLYPGANILVADKTDFTKQNRERLFSRVATGDWDAVVVAHSSFKKMALPGFPWVADLLMSFPEGTNEGYGPIFSDSRADRALVC